MKVIRILFILGTLGIIILGLISMSNNAISFTADSAEVASYRAHHRPAPGRYYSVEEVSTENGKTFVIGTIVRPQVGGTVSKSDRLVEIEVPTKKEGALKGAFCIVRKVDGIPTTIYFVGEKEVVNDALQN